MSDKQFLDNKQYLEYEYLYSGNQKRLSSSCHKMRVHGYVLILIDAFFKLHQKFSHFRQEYLQMCERKASENIIIQIS